MDETAKKIINLMFRAGEEICVSPNKYGWHSMPLEKAISGRLTLVPPDTSRPIQYCDSSDLTLIALNPIKGFREDLNCTAFRNFLVEIDTGTIQEQLTYIKKIGLPYSAAIFSGNKSLHFLISLDSDLPSENVYRKLAEWTLGVVTLADQQTKNPSRSIRIPGAWRDIGKKQELVEYHGPISLETLANFLKQHPDAKPKEKPKRTISDKAAIENIKPWICRLLVDGIKPPNRNKQWFTIACEFAIAGYLEDDTILILESYFEEDRDFKRKEWLTTIKSGFKRIHQRCQVD